MGIFVGVVRKVTQAKLRRWVDDQFAGDSSQLRVSRDTVPCEGQRTRTADR